MNSRNFNAMSLKRFASPWKKKRSRYPARTEHSHTPRASSSLPQKTHARADTIAPLSASAPAPCTPSSHTRKKYQAPSQIASIFMSMFLPSHIKSFPEKRGKVKAHGCGKMSPPHGTSRWNGFHTIPFLLTPICLLAISQHIARLIPHRSRY